MTTSLGITRGSDRAVWPRALYELSRAVASASEPSDIFEAALSCLHQSLGVKRAAVLVFDRDGVMRFEAWRGLSDTYRADIEGHTPWTPEAIDPTPVLIEDVSRDLSLEALRPAIQRERIRALAFIPVVIGPTLLGKFMLYYSAPHVFTEHEVLTAQAIAAHVAFAIDQQAHRESERRYRELLPTLGVAVYTTDADGRITLYNDEAAALWGRRPKLGVDLWSGAWKLSWSDGTPMLHEECPMAVALQEGRPVRGCEAVVERPDGTRAYFVPYPTPLFDDAGKLTGAVNVLVDITARKLAEAALEEKGRRLVSALAEKDELLAGRDDTIRLNESVQLQLTSLIEASGALIGVTHDESAVSTILGIAAQLLRADAHAMWQFTRERDQWEIVSAQGLSAGYIRDSGLRDKEGRQRLKSAMVVEDVETEELLGPFRDRHRAEGIRSIFAAPLGLGDRTNGTLTFYYRTVHRFSGLEVRVGTALANLASASLTDKRLFEENERSRDELQKANDELFSTAEELRVANAAKDEFLGLVSHELKTPLTTIQGNAAVLSRSKQIGPEDHDAALGDIVQESERLHRIIENLLSLARAEQGEGFEAEPLMLVRVLQRLVDRHKQRNPQRSYEIVEHGESRPVVFSEPCLEQVMENLISNAEKYSPPDERITIEFERGPDEVKMRVLDRGVGLGQASADRLFEAFYRSRSARARADGLGIGLAVCKRLVEAQGGRMWAANRGGGGSEFGFALPLSNEDCDDPASAAAIGEVP